MSLEDFPRQVAAREGAGADEEALFSQVFEHARAGFGTLSEAVSHKEWFDIVVELPEDTGPSCRPAPPDPQSAAAGGYNWQEGWEYPIS